MNTTETQTQEMKVIAEREHDLTIKLYQAAEMGRETLEHVNDNMSGGELKKAVEKDILDYSDICNQLTRKLGEKGQEPKSVGKIPRMMSSMMINIKINDETPECEIAKMVIDGTTKGVTETTAMLSEYSDVNDEIKNIGYKLLWVEQKNIDEMRRFLHN